MTRFEIHSIDSAPQGARPTLEAAKERFGFLPNLLGEFAAAPPALEAYVTLNGLLEKTSLSPVEQQLVLLAVSVANGCDYCVAAHTAGLKQSGFDADELEAARSGRSLQDPRQEALRSFTTAVVEKRGHPEEEDLESFFEAGFEKEQVFEVLVGVAMKTLSNYTNHIAGTSLDRELEPFAWEAAAV